MRVFLSAVLIAAACLAAPVHAADHPHAADVAAINRVVEQFKAAIVAHDGKTLDTLFLQDHDSWLVVAAVDDATWATVKERNPKARRVLADSRKQFVEFVQNNPKSIEERFYTSASTPTARSVRSGSTSISSRTARSPTAAAKPGRWCVRKMAGKSARCCIRWANETVELQDRQYPEAVA